MQSFSIPFTSPQAWTSKSSFNQKFAEKYFKKVFENKKQKE